VSYKVYLPAALDPIAWSQVTWQVEAQTDAGGVEEELIHDVVLDVLPRGGRVADAGCGMAKWPSALRRLGYRAVGVDISRDALALARRRDPGVALVVADSRRLPFRDRVLDAVLSIGVVEHEEAGPHASLCELRRLLKPGGILVLDVPYDNLVRRLCTNHLQTWVTRRRRRAGWTLGFSEYRFTYREVVAAVERAGFTVCSAHPNDRRPPKNVGVWVDYRNLVFDPFKPMHPAELFVLPRPVERVVTLLMRAVPWLLCGTVTVVAKAQAA
jgi:SAM-dependent methyltransferase